MSRQLITHIENSPFGIHNIENIGIRMMEWLLPAGDQEEMKGNTGRGQNLGDMKSTRRNKGGFIHVHISFASQILDLCEAWNAPPVEHTLSLPRQSSTLAPARDQNYLLYFVIGERKYVFVVPTGTSIRDACHSNGSICINCNVSCLFHLLSNLHQNAMNVALILCNEQRWN